MLQKALPNLSKFILGSLTFNVFLRQTISGVPVRFATKASDLILKVDINEFS